jgi:hypothetical protein
MSVSLKLAERASEALANAPLCLGAGRTSMPVRRWIERASW